MAITENMAGGTFTRISPGECAAMLSEGQAVLLDIREIHEFYSERIPGALLAPMQEIVPTALPAQDGKKIILQCLAGIRTVHMAETLISSGAYTEIAHLEGGIIAWKAENLPTIGADSGS